MPTLTNHVDVVTRVKAELLAVGVSIAGPCGAFEITKRVAWECQKLEPGLRPGLIAKVPGQAGCAWPGHPDPDSYYGHQVIIYPDGTHYDILIAAGNLNEPSWALQQIDGQPFLRPELWRPAQNPIAPPIPPEPVPIPPQPFPKVIKVRLRTYNGHYVRAEGGGGSTLDATATSGNIWEEFFAEILEVS
jgi:hypothetical protein